MATEQYLGDREAFEELGAATKLVCVFFTADLHGGVHAIRWGEAHLEPDRTFTWLHREELPLAPVPRRDAATGDGGDRATGVTGRRG